jgi:hypothetical protein
MSRSEDAGSRVLDVRTYRLIPGKRRELDRIFREGALPMLERYGIDVVASGPSLDDDDSYCLIRGFASPSQRRKQLDAFYGSGEWLRNYDDAVMALIESYHVVLIEQS